MIIVKLLGGLGNQMFQYAAGRRLSIVHDVTLKLDTSWFSYRLPDGTARPYALGVFAIQENFATQEEVRSLTGEVSSDIYNRLRSLMQKLKLIHGQREMVKERFLHFDRTVLNLPENAYLEGYWQSEKYFLDVAGVLRKEFTLKEPLAGKNLEIADQIRNTCSVSIHVRRGDYVSNPGITEFHGVCEPAYYHRCIDELSRKFSNAHFFVFSDDPVWTRVHLNFDYPVTYVDHNDSDKGYEDMRLMSLCRHNIIANSSFSWWGAWLNPNPDKLVYAPQRWFNRPDIDTRDLVPSSWIRR